MKMRTGTSAKKKPVPKQVHASGGSMWKYMGITAHSRDIKRPFSMADEGYFKLKGDVLKKHYENILRKTKSIDAVLELETKRVMANYSLDEKSAKRKARYNLFQMGINEKL